MCMPETECPTWFGNPVAGLTRQGCRTRRGGSFVNNSNSDEQEVAGFCEKGENDVVVAV